MATPQQMPIDMNIPGAPMRRVPSELSLSGNRLLGVTRDELHPNSLTTIFEELINPTARDLEWEFAVSGYSSTTPPPVNTNVSFDIDNYYLREGELSISVGYPAPPSKNEEIRKCKCKRAYLIVNKMTDKTRLGHKNCGLCDHNVIEKN
jgi:hypothetical protein